ITNCIIMGRLEAFALANKPWPSVLDGIGNGFAYAAILVLVAFFRELFGSGKLYGYDVLLRFGYEPNGLMILPPMALIVVGLIIWAQRARNTKLIEEH
ncbi:MAG: NADH:ubiquinone reductase (Na(+)-transporting) subunit D, partial [Bacteroidetes bacterium]|nr:NADH:ubiquinone reductase (Na(+)-transporting) subunit D [Bacteroidota bacterium]